MAQPNIPPAVRIALLVLLNHIEPGWENCTLLVRGWLDGACGPDAGGEAESRDG